MASVERLTHWPSVVRDPFLSFAEGVGLEADNLLFALLLLLAIPVGFIHSRIPFQYGKFRHTFSTVIGIIWIYALYGPGSFWALLSGYVVYFMVQVLPLDNSAFLATVFSLGYLSFFHIYRMVTEYMVWRMDFTTPLMVIVVKAMTFAYAYTDGQKLLKNKDLVLHEKKHAHEEFKSKSIDRLPSLMEYTSYLCFYGTALSGPAFSIKRYLAFQDGTLFTSRGFKSTPNTILPTLLKFGRVIACFAVLECAPMYPVEFMLTKDFEAYSVLKKNLFIWISIFLCRFKYFFAWYLAEESCIACGFGMEDDSTPGNLKWNALNNCFVLRVDMNTSLVDMINNWNKGVHDWLKDNIYLRVKTPKALKKAVGISDKTFAMICTRATSAFWHGFYPGYYMFFLGANVLNAGEAALQKVLTGFNSPPFQLLRWAFINFSMNYLGVAFLLLDARLVWKVWSSTWFMGFSICLIPITLQKIFKKPRHRTAEVKSASLQNNEKNAQERRYSSTSESDGVLANGATSESESSHKKTE